MKYFRKEALAVDVLTNAAHSLIKEMQCVGGSPNGGPPIGGPPVSGPPDILEDGKIIVTKFGICARVCALYIHGK